jgi:hypothetical protein
MIKNKFTKNIKEKSPRQALPLQRAIEARSRNHLCRVKTVIILYSEYVFLALVKQCACAVLYCHLWSVWLYKLFPICFTNCVIFGRGLLNVKVCFDIINHFV